MHQTDSQIFTVGDAFVGKTTYLRHYFYGASSSFNAPTIGEESFFKDLPSSDGSSFKICFWDTAGQERFNSLTLSHFKHERSGLILMFSLTDESSLDNCIHWYDQITKHSPLGSKLPTILIGNKKDLVNARRVLEEDIENVSKKLKVDYFLISSITGENMKESVDRICELVKNLPPKDCAITVTVNDKETSSANDESTCYC